MRKKLHLLTVLLLACIAGAAMADTLASAPANLVPNKKKAHKAEILGVSTLQDGKTKVVALLTYPDGTRDKCEWVMQTKQVNLGKVSSLEIVPEGSSSRCTPYK